jgi:hypothetical protein
MRSQYQQLNPLALAVAAGATELVGSVLLGFWMMATMGGPSMMGVYSHRSAMALIVAWWIGVLLAALAGALFAWVYNAVNATNVTTLEPPA